MLGKPVSFEGVFQRIRCGAEIGVQPGGNQESGDAIPEEDERRPDLAIEGLLGFGAFRIAFRPLLCLA